MTLPPRWIAPLHVAAYLMATVLWLIALGVGVAVFLLVRGGSIDFLNDPGLVEGLTVVQLLGMVVIAVPGALLLTPRPRSGLGLARTFGFHAPSAAGLALAGLLGLVVGLFPAWVTTAFGDWLPPSLVEQLIGDGLDGSLSSLLRAFLMVCVAAPVCEELVFRGYLWAAFERSHAPPWLTVLATSLLFTGYHLDPTQMIGVLPIALALGWTRWRTGSVWAGMVLHFANNALALGASVAGDDSDLPAWLGLASLGLSLGLCAALGRWGRPPSRGA